MSSNLIFDTSAYSNLRKGSAALEQLLAGAAGLSVPVAVIAELEYGFMNGNDYSKNYRELEHFLAQDFVQVLYIDSLQLAKHFAGLKLFCKKKGRALSEHDLWIASLAKQHDYELVTFDQDFEVLKELLPSTLHILKD